MSLPTAALMVKASSMAVRWAAVRVSAVVTELVASVAVGVSVRSRSVKVIEPASLSVVPSRMSPVTSTTATTGTSLTPVILIVWLLLPCSELPSPVRPGSVPILPRSFTSTVMVVLADGVSELLK